MKRMNGDVENSESKEVKFFNENVVDLDKSEGKEETVLALNGGVDSAQVDGKGSLLGDGLADNFDGPSLGGAEGSNKWDFDINVEIIVGNEEEQNDSDIDPNGEGDLDLELEGLPSLIIAACESNLATGGEWRYTREEKGKTSYSVDLELELEVDSDESTQLIEPPEDVEVIPRRHVNEETRRRTARSLARTTLSDQNSGNLSSSQKQQLHIPNPVEQLGNLPGPFADALKMVRERTSKGGAQQLIQRRPLLKNQEESVTTTFVPSLLDLSLKALAKSAEGIVSLGQVPDGLRRRLTDILCDMGGMNACFLNLLVEGCPTEIRLKNCAWLNEQQFQQTIGKCQTKCLRVLQLDLCGQCMLDIEFRNILDRCSSSFTRLAIVSLRGACRLTDYGLRDLVVSAPLLRSINLGHCTLLTSDSIGFVADIIGSNLRELYIDECHKIDILQSLPALKKFKHLEVLSVSGIRSVNDWFVSEIVTAFGQSLRELDFADCFKLTDYSLKIIGKSCADLCSLNISNLNLLTDLGMEYLANGCRSIQKLKLRHNKFSDEAVAAFLESSGESLLELSLNSIAKIGPITALSLAKCSRMLLSLDISWCRRISNEALGLIVDSCSSLKLLKIFGCRQITIAFPEEHSNRLLRIVGPEFTSIMDHLYLFDPEEVLLRYSALPDCMED